MENKEILLAGVGVISSSSLRLRPEGWKAKSLLVQISSNFLASSTLGADCKIWIEMNFWGSSPRWKFRRWEVIVKNSRLFLKWLLWLAHLLAMAWTLVEEEEALPTASGCRWGSQPRRRWTATWADWRSRKPVWLATSLPKDWTGYQVLLLRRIWEK